MSMWGETESDFATKGLTTNETLPSDDIAKRMEALVRALAESR